MTQYLLNVIVPVMPPARLPPPEFLSPIMREARRDQPTTCRRPASGSSPTGSPIPSRHRRQLAQDGELLLTDGPYVEGKEHLGGFTIVDCPDLDARAGRGRSKSPATGLPDRGPPVRRARDD